MTEAQLLEAVRLALQPIPAGKGLTMEEMSEALKVPLRPLRKWAQQALKEGILIRVREPRENVSGRVVPTTVFALCERS